jgi:hypothetical protein
LFQYGTDIRQEDFEEVVNDKDFEVGRLFWSLLIA